MVELSLMASAANSRTILVPDQVLHRVPKGLQIFLRLHGNKLYTLRSSSSNLISQYPEDLQQPANLLSDCILCSKAASSIFERGQVFDVQDSRLDSLTFSLGIAEKCIRHGKMIKFLMPGSDLGEKDLDMSLLSDLMELKPVTVDMQPHTTEHCEESFYIDGAEMHDAHQVLIPKKHLFVPEPYGNCYHNLSPTLFYTSHSDGRLIFVTSEMDTEDILSMIDEFSVSSTRKAMVVPYFTRKGRGRSKAKVQVSPKLETQFVSPLQSPGDINMKPAHIKRNKKFADQQDLYQRNYFHACESLLSFVLDKNKDSMAVVSLKKSSPEISQLLTTVSAGIAGTGLWVIFSVFFRSAYANTPICSTTLLSTGLGLGLFWLSSAVCKLRDTIVVISKKSSKNLNLQEISGKVNKSMKEIMLRAVVILAVGILRLA